MKGLAPSLSLLAVTMLNTACERPNPQAPLDIIVFAVGQGSAVLVQTPDSRTCLIDGGPAFAGANRIWPVLDSLQIREVDYCFALNYTAGRIGGLDEVIRRLNGEEGILFRCYDRGASVRTPGFGEYAAAVGRRRHRIGPGDEIRMGELTIRCLAADGRVLGRKPVETTNEEDRSIALLLSYNDFDLLIPGDLAASTELGRPDLLNQVADLVDEVEILILGSNGSQDAISFQTFEKLNPVVSVIPVGADQESLPAVQTLTQVSRRGRRVYVTRRTATTAVAESHGRVVNGNIRISVYDNFYTVAGDTMRARR